jgi:hypothetical protein
MIRWFAGVRLLMRPTGEMMLISRCCPIKHLPSVVRTTSPLHLSRRPFTGKFFVCSSCILSVSSHAHRVCGTGRSRAEPRGTVHIPPSSGSTRLIPSLNHNMSYDKTVPHAVLGRLLAQQCCSLAMTTRRARHVLIFQDHKLLSPQSVSDILLEHGTQNPLQRVDT